MPLAHNWSRLHEVSEAESTRIAVPTFAVVIARSAGGAVLVFNRFRKVWELPGGLIDPGESPGEAVRRELLEEAECTRAGLPLAGAGRNQRRLDAFRSGVRLRSRRCTRGSTERGNCWHCVLATRRSPCAAGGDRLRATRPIRLNWHNDAHAFHHLRRARGISE